MAVALASTTGGFDQLGLYLDGGRHAGAQKLEGLGDGQIQLERHALRLGLAAEGENLADEVGRPRGAAGNVIQIADGGGILGDFQFGEVEVADHGGQNIVEIMGDAAGELADGFHLLRLAKLGFQLPALGDVAERPDAAVIFPRRIADGRGITVEDGAINQFNHVMAGLVGMRVKVGHLFDELARMFFLAGIEHGVRGFGLASIAGQWNFPNLGHPPVLQNDLAQSVHHQDAVQRRFQLGLQHGSFPQQFFLRVLTFLAQPLLFQRAFDGIAQPRNPVLEQIIRGAAPHGFHGGLLAHGSGNQDERKVQTARPQQLHRPQTGELRQGIIGQDDVRQFFKLREKIRLRLHALPHELQAGAPQLRHHQLRIIGRILDYQDFEWRGHGAGNQGLGVWLNCSQYCPNMRTDLPNSSKSIGLTM